MMTKIDIALQNSNGSPNLGAGSPNRGAGSWIRRNPAQFNPWVGVRLRDG